LAPMAEETNQPLRKAVITTQVVLEPEPTVYSVESLNIHIKQLLEGQIGVVWVKGEISNFKVHTSGHFYFSLKDAKSQISAVMFRGHNSKLKFKPNDGMEVIVRGRLSVYEPRGNYQLLCEMLEPVGAGALQKAYEQLKAKLKSEGLFDSSKKKLIPTFPQHIAIVTSPTGAAIRDILNILSRRAKAISVTVVPTIVQGESASPSIREAFKKAMSLPAVDVIIIGRGGGSIEDMWCFNDEELARLISASHIPVISAVGHEIDFTIADFVADLRAPTPSAAAELVAKSSVELASKIASLERLLKMVVEKQLNSLREKMLGLAKRLVDPKKRLQDLELRNDDLLSRLELAIQRYLGDQRHRVDLLKEKLGSPDSLIQGKYKDIDHLQARSLRAVNFSLERKKSQVVYIASLLDSLSPLKVVERGYSIVMCKQKVIKSYAQVKKGDQLRIRLAQGSLTATIDLAEENNNGF
jgi:exodeoxyribonuclease VII large subunit